MTTTPVAIHPVQGSRYPLNEKRMAPQAVTLRAYEVYKAVYGEKVALVTGECRGGFSVGELVAFLYASGFPRNEWQSRVDEAFRGMKL